MLGDYIVIDITVTTEDQIAEWKTMAEHHPQPVSHPARSCQVCSKCSIPWGQCSCEMYGHEMAEAVLRLVEELERRKYPRIRNCDCLHVCKHSVGY